MLLLSVWLDAISTMYDATDSEGLKLYTLGDKLWKTYIILIPNNVQKDDECKETTLSNKKRVHLHPSFR